MVAGFGDKNWGDEIRWQLRLQKVLWLDLFRFYFSFSRKFRLSCSIINLFGEETTSNAIKTEV